ncbi:hypothetical protein NQ317_017371 [Molorchus minor]|uniref:Uncharacterized protein n=1 Tax=Molorchus minor TaxID=1323400 RepID=A0ABQ9JRC2_9CUCU|nr:hypothetical protein NQ317_017371 [Molorchus minor]
MNGFVHQRVCILQTISPMSLQSQSPIKDNYLKVIFCSRPVPSFPVPDIFNCKIMEISSDDELSSTPPNLLNAANSVISNLLSGISRRQYENAYQQFKEWREANKARKISENVLLVYFAEKSKKIGNHPKKSKVLTREEINQVIREADNETYLMVKVVLILGISGACRRLRNLLK